MKYFENIKHFFQDGMKIIVVSVAAIIFGLVRLTFQKDQMEDGINGIGEFVSIAVYVYAAGALFCIFIIAATILISSMILKIDMTDRSFSDDALVVALITIAVTSITFWLIKIGFV